jgi:predicted CXXCH cytochrome family protein
MSQTFGVMNEANAVADFREANTFHHERSDRYYEMIERGGVYYQGRYQLDHDGRRINEFEQRITHFLGSGVNERDYLHLTPEGRLTQMPIVWYGKLNRWGIAPGYDQADHAGFTRDVSYDCMFCHNGYPAPSTVNDRESLASYPQVLPEGIDCQRCHGPGSAHIQLASDEHSTIGDVRAAIVNPAKLDHDRALDVCAQCHLETTSFDLPDMITRFDRGVFSFKPGERLTDARVHFDYAPGSGREDRFEIVGQVYRMRQSPCFVQSNGGLTCTTCHDPHVATRGIPMREKTRSQCLTCHDLTSLASHQEMLQADVSGGGDCTSCHMPARRTEDVVRLVMTDHRIGIHDLSTDTTAPRDEMQVHYRGGVEFYREPPDMSSAEKELLLGVAHVRYDANVGAGIRMIESALGDLSPASSIPYVELALAYLKLGRAAPAVKWLEQAVSVEPDNPRAWNNLGKSRESVGDQAGARQAYEKALELDQQNTFARTNLASVLARNGDLDAATAQAVRAVSLDPFSFEAHRTLGLVYAVSGNWESAADALGTAQKIKPNDPAVLSSLVQVGDSQGFAREVVPLLVAALRVSPGDEGLRRATAMCAAACARQGSCEEAWTCFDALNDADAFPPADLAHLIQQNCPR